MKVVKPGLFTTVQDLGREGYQEYGIVAAGAMDSFSLQVGNILVGNKEGEAGLEITLLGPELHIVNDGVIAICGANLSPSINGEPVPIWKAIKVKKGQFLTFGERKTGARAYLTIAGGIDVEPVFGSKSTYVKGGMGGYQGRPLQKGDLLKKGKDSFEDKGKYIGRALSTKYTPRYGGTKTLRVIPGPDIGSFTEEALMSFFSSTYDISREADRMGYRLNGKKLTHKRNADIISDAISFGAIQVPANGQPIILMADRQTTGGYARIGAVISVDLPLLGQLIPGQSVTFQKISIEKAQELYRKKQKWFRYFKLETRNV
ncbi:antagonist of KipI [Evansella vedderi]|uniref:Antagonist of KipI n=1 Tax=Evansella vedderi TaxID=38282 RepID=A0ABT9ZW29_9BACI|nr:antagonist of KipI [Evansella vedderi]